MRRLPIVVVLSMLCGLLAFVVPSVRAAQLPSVGLPGAGGTQHYGDLTFPKDEHTHYDGLDYWWGAAEVVTASGRLTGLEPVAARSTDLPSLPTLAARKFIAGEPMKPATNTVAGLS